MLQSIRENLQGVVSYFIVGLIVVVFALFGAETLFQAPQSNSVVEVDGKPITELDLQRAIAMRKQQFQSMFGQNVDPRFLSEEFLREPALNGLIQRRLLEGAVEEQKLAVNSDVLDQQIVSENMFQLEGKFDPDYYRQLLRQAGYTPSSYREQLKVDFLINQYQRAFLDSAFVTERELDDVIKLEYEQRSFEYITLPLEDYFSEVSLSDEDIAAYYEENKDQYISEEQVSVEYIELKKQDLESVVEVAEEDIVAQYQSEVDAMNNTAERHAAHILIEESDDGSHDQVLADIQTRLEAGEEFSDLAKEFSFDTGSAEQGGDVGFTQGDSFVPEFEEALATLQVGEVSGPVKTDFGYHIIKLLAVNDVTPPTLEESRSRIEQQLKEVLADDLFVENLDFLRESGFQSENLADLLKQLPTEIPALRVDHSKAVAKNSTKGIMGNYAVQDLLFTKGLQPGQGAELVEINDLHGVLIEVLERRMPEVKPLEDVKSSVVKTLTSQKAIEMLREKSTEIKESLVAEGSSLEQVAQAEGLQWQVARERLRVDPEVDSKILGEAFAVEASALESDDIDERLQSFHLDNGDLVLMRLTAINIPDSKSLSASDLNQVKNRLESSAASDEFAIAQRMLASKAKITQ